MRRTGQHKGVHRIQRDKGRMSISPTVVGDRYSEQVSGCYPAEIVARSTEGDDYARQGPRQLCADDVWTITEPDP